MFLLFLSSPVSDIIDVDAMKPEGEWNGTGGGGGIYRRAGITWAAGNGFKPQAYPCLSSVTIFLILSNREFGSPEACPKPVHGALVIPPPQPYPSTTLHESCIKECLISASEARRRIDGVAGLRLDSQAWFGRGEQVLLGVRFVMKLYYCINGFAKGSFFAVCQTFFNRFSCNVIESAVFYRITNLPVGISLFSSGNKRLPILTLILF